MKLIVNFKFKDKLQAFFEEAQDLFEMYGATVSFDKEGSAALKEIIEEVKE